MNIVVLDGYTLNPGDLSWDALSQLGPCTIHDRTPPELVLERSREAEVILTNKVVLGRETILALPRLQYIGVLATGCNVVDAAAAKERGIPVANVPDYGTEEVADSAIGLMLTMTRGIHFLNSRLRDKQGPWMYTQVVPLHRLRTLTFGVIGLGAIGTAAALRAKALGMTVVFYDKYKQDGYDKALGLRRVDTLDELLAQSNVLSLHTPLTPETKHMINAETMAKLPMGSYLVNTGRGALIDTAAIPAAIVSGRLAGAGIDVLEAEPARDNDPLVVAWRDPSHPAHHRVIINPHSAFYSVEGLMDMRVKGAENCRRAILGQMLRNVVNG